MRRNIGIPSNAITDLNEARDFLNQREPGDRITIFYKKTSSSPIESMTVEVEDTQVRRDAGESAGAYGLVYLKKKKRDPRRPTQYGWPTIEVDRGAIFYAPYAQAPLSERSRVIALKSASKRAARANPTTPRIYVANLAAYNAGRMKGKWIEPSSDEGELVDQVVEAIGGNADDEYAFHDYDGFPNMGENPDLEDVAAMAALLEEHPYGIVKAAMDIVGDEVDAIKKLLDEGYGVYESKKDYAEELIENMGGVDQLDRNTLERHFDYDSFTREVFDDVASSRVDGLGLVVFNAR